MQRYRDRKTTNKIDSMRGIYPKAFEKYSYRSGVINRAATIAIHFTILPLLISIVLVTLSVVSYGWIGGGMIMTMGCVGVVCSIFGLANKINRWLLHHEAV
jgi:hypothetical protein